MPNSHVDIIASVGSTHQNEHAQALQEGFAKLGIPTKICPGPAHAHSSEVVVWGWRQGEALKRQGKRVLVMERGYIGDRFSWTSLAFDGLNGRGSFSPPKQDGGARFRENHAGLLKSWNADGKYVLLIGQVHGDAALQGRDLQGWYNSIAKECAARGMNLVFRPHPVELAKGVRRSVPGFRNSTKTLAEDLEDAYLVVTWNSNTGVDAMLAGKPIMVVDQGSMAWSVAQCNTLENFQTSEPANRSQWAHELAWCQWSLEEMRNGTALSHLLPARPESAILGKAIKDGLAGV